MLPVTVKFSFAPFHNQIHAGMEVILQRPAPFGIPLKLKLSCNWWGLILKENPAFSELLNEIALIQYTV